MRNLFVVILSIFLFGCANTNTQADPSFFDGTLSKLPGDVEYANGNFSDALRIYVERAEAEPTNEPLLNRIGEMYEKGWGAAKNQGLAEVYFRRAAKLRAAAEESERGARSIEAASAGEEGGEEGGWFSRAAEKSGRGGRAMLDWIDAGTQGAVAGARRLMNSDGDATDPQEPSFASTPPADAGASNELSRPSGDELVASVQAELNALGYDAGPADGLMGRRTRSAIRSFQQAQGLAPDGEATPKLLIEVSQAGAATVSAPAVEVAAVQKPTRKSKRSARAKSSGKRVALVIGNSAYSNTVALSNPKRDANAIAAKLRSLDFEVVVRTDLDSVGMRRALRDFRKRLRGSELSLFYYAGHAVQLDGDNFLLPINAQIEEEADLRYDAVTLDAVMSEMEKSSASRLLILDACRDNPFVTQLASATPRTRSAKLARGLAVSRRDTVGTLIAYATSPDKVARDGVGRNSPYTAALIKWIDQPGLEIGEVFRRVREEVIRTTNRQQIPWENSSLVGDGIYLAGDE